MFLYAALLLLAISATLGLPNIFERQSQCFSQCSTAFNSSLCNDTSPDIFCGCSKFTKTVFTCYNCLNSSAVDPLSLELVKSVLDICQHCQTPACGSFLLVGECLSGGDSECFCPTFKENGTECANCLAKFDPTYPDWFEGIITEFCDVT